MRIVNLETFRTLPIGTLYSDYEPCVFGPLSIKGETWDYDFLTKSIADAIDNEGSDDFADKLLKAQKTGEDLPMNFDCFGRDGLFNKDQLFAVWSKKDFNNFIGMIRKLDGSGSNDE